MALAITNVAGTLSNGQSVVITGTDFGATGPTIEMFDDFEGGTNGNDIENQSAKLGAWGDSADRDSATYSNLNARGGSSSLSMRFWCGATGTEDYQQIRDSLSNATYVYQSWWTLMPSGQEWPGHSISNVNYKLSWLGAAGGWPDNDYAALVVLGDPPSVAFTAGCDDPGDGPGQRYGYVDEGGIDIADFNMAIGTWIRFSAYFKGSESAGEVKFWQVSSEGNEQLSLTNSNPYTQDDGHPWTWINFPGYARGETGTYPQFDDIYIATGAAAQARIEIGNNATYANCTNLAVCTPTAWANGEITCTLRTGSFASDASCYLFVIDSSGSASSGYGITLGGISSSSILHYAINTPSMSATHKMNRRLHPKI